MLNHFFSSFYHRNHAFLDRLRWLRAWTICSLASDRLHKASWVGE
jgi:hypothetical protein